MFIRPKRSYGNAWAFFIFSVPLRLKKHGRQGGTDGSGKGSYSMIILKERWRSRSLNTKETNN